MGPGGAPAGGPFEAMMRIREGLSDDQSSKWTIEEFCQDNSVFVDKSDFTNFRPGLQRYWSRWLDPCILSCTKVGDARLPWHVEERVVCDVGWWLQLWM